MLYATQSIFVAQVYFNSH